MKELQYAFTVHICKYLGIALVAGSIVHAGTLGGSTTKYLLLIVFGIIITVFGNWLEYKQKNINIPVNVLALAILLSFGTGMLSGGIQHYADNPVYGAGLLALGLILTYLSLAYKDFSKSVTLRSVAIVSIISIILYILLSTVGATAVSHLTEGVGGSEINHHD